MSTDFLPWLPPFAGLALALVCLTRKGRSVAFRGSGYLALVIAIAAGIHANSGGWRAESKPRANGAAVRGADAREQAMPEELAGVVRLLRQLKQANIQHARDELAGQAPAASPEKMKLPDTARNAQLVRVSSAMKPGTTDGAMPTSE